MCGPECRFWPRRLRLFVLELAGRLRLGLVRVMLMRLAFVLALWLLLLVLPVFLFCLFESFGIFGIIERLLIDLLP